MLGLKVDIGAATVVLTELGCGGLLVVVVVVVIAGFLEGVNWVVVGNVSGGGRGFGLRPRMDDSVKVHPTTLFGLSHLPVEGL